ncbi:MAG: metal ABC transporter substrate-binding protein [Planctomycetota bacterium]
MKTLLLALMAVSVAAADDKLDVVTTIPSLGSVAREVGGDRVSVSSLARPGEDPHFVDAKQSLMVKMRGADLFIVNGLELEIGWVPLLLEGCRNGKIQPGSAGYLDASAFVRVIDVPKGPVDRSMGDVHPMGNPHFSLDPLALRGIAGGLAVKLSALDPGGKEVYERNRKAYERKIDEALFGAELVDEAGGSKLAQVAADGKLDEFLAEQKLADQVGGWLKVMADAKGKEVIAYHASMNYFWNRFGLKLAGTIEEKPGISPSSSQVNSIIELARARKIRAVVTQPFFSDSAPNLIAEKSGAKVVKVDIEGDDAIAIIDHVVTEVAGALK